MFNDDKKNSSSQGSVSSVDTKLSFSDEKAAQPVNIPIHTMKQDLQNINNPQYFDAPDNKIDLVEPVKTAYTPETQDSKLRTSPFLSQNNQNSNKISERTNEPSLIPPSNDKQDRITVTPTPHTPSSWGKLVLMAIVIFLIFAAGAGGYYYWMNKKNITTIPKESAPVIPPKPSIALDKPNYLNIDISTGKIVIADAIDKYIKEVEKEKPTTPVEFVISDSLNNPILFKDFAAISGISLPPDVMNLLKDSFSFFIYLDEDQPRVGLAIDSNDLIGTNLKDALTKNEPDLAKQMEPMYLSRASANQDDEFSTSYYGGAEIRFRNFDSTESLSLDYTIFRDKLIFGTSKMTLRSVIDYLTTTGKVQGMEDILENIPEEALQNGSIEP